MTIPGFMKKLLLSLLTVFILFPAFPQQLKQMHIIGNPKKLTDEGVAKLDANGEYAAAIQIITDIEGLDYDSNDGIVADVDRWPGKDMVYVTHRERALYVFKQGYEQLKIYLTDHGIILKPQEVWQIKIAGDEKAETLLVVIRFTPEDAQLFIDGNEMQISPTYSLEVGEHQVKIIKDGYQILDEKISVNQNNVLFEYQLERIKDAALQITTEPEGATVFIDGIKMGETPVAAFYPPGTYPIRIVKEGYVAIENETIEITVPNTRKDYRLDENVGWLTVNTHENATVYFNGEVVENPDRVKLTPQLVKVKVTQPKADDLEQQVLLKKDDDVVLDMYPVVKTGTIQVAVTPFDAKVELTGDAGEYFTSEGMKVFEDVPVGNYTIRLSAKNHGTITHSLTLKNDSVISCTLSLLKVDNLQGVHQFDTSFRIFKYNETYIKIPKENGQLFLDDYPLANEYKILISPIDTIFIPLNEIRVFKNEISQEKDKLSKLYDFVDHIGLKYSTKSDFRMAYADPNEARKLWEILFEIEVVDLEFSSFYSKYFGEKSFADINGIEMVFVEGGTFMMGSEEELFAQPIHSVTLSDFYIGKYEVTQKLWCKIMGENPSFFTNGDNYPVEKVSWYEVQEFIKQLNKHTGKVFRLPTEAEWEYAAKGSKLGLNACTKYSGSNLLEVVAWFEGNSNNRTHPVGMKAPNELGIYDMTGNVMEWCEDWFGDYNNLNLRDSIRSKEEKYKVARGGSWFNSSIGCSNSYRNFFKADDSTNIHLGFRLALTP